jgi:hypothetical protein
LNTARQKGLEKHNVYRRKHRVGNLVLNENLNYLAQNYARKLAATNKFEHSNTKNGENLYMICSMKPNILGDFLKFQKYNELIIQFMFQKLWLKESMVGIMKFHYIIIISQHLVHKLDISHNLYGKHLHNLESE